MEHGSVPVGIRAYPTAHQGGVADRPPLGVDGAAIEIHAAESPLRASESVKRLVVKANHQRCIGRTAIGMGNAQSPLLVCTRRKGGTEGAPAQHETLVGSGAHDVGLVVMKLAIHHQGKAGAGTLAVLLAIQKVEARKAVAHGEVLEGTQFVVGKEGVVEFGLGRGRTYEDDSTVALGRMAGIGKEGLGIGRPCVGLAKEGERLAEARARLAFYPRVPAVATRGQSRENGGKEGCTCGHAIGEHAGAVHHLATGILLLLPQAVDDRMGQLLASSTQAGELLPGKGFAAYALGPRVGEHRLLGGGLHGALSLGRLATIAGDGATYVKEKLIVEIGAALALTGHQIYGQGETALGIRDGFAALHGIFALHAEPHTAVGGPLHAGTGHRQARIGAGCAFKAQRVAQLVIGCRSLDFGGKGGTLVFLHAESLIGLRAILSLDADAEIARQRGFGKVERTAKTAHFIGKYVDSGHLFAVGVHQTGLGFVGSGHADAVSLLCEDDSAEVDLLAWAIDGAVGEGVDAGGGSGARLRGIETAMTIGDALIGAGEDIAAAACHQPTGSEGHGEGEGAVGCGGVCAQLLAVFVQQHNAGIGQGHTAAAIHDHEAQLVVARGYLKRTHTADVHQSQGLSMAVHRYAQCVDAFPVEGHGKGIAQLLPGDCGRVILRHIYGTAFESAANVLVVPVCLLAAFGHLLSRERGVVKLQAYLAIVFAYQANAEAISGINQVGICCKLHARILLGLDILLQGARLLFLFVEVVALVRQGKEQAVGSAYFAIKVEETQIGMHVEREVAVFAGQLLEGLQFLIAAILGITAA